MKFILSTLTVVAFFAVGKAVDDFEWPPIANQTNKAAYCSRQYKSFVKCSLKSDYAGSGVWKLPEDRVCNEEYFPEMKECLGTTLDYDNKEDASQINPFAKPASVLVAGMASGAMKGYYALPDDSEKIYPISCSVCDKYTKEYLACSLPLLGSGKNEVEAYQSCAKTEGEKMLFNTCLINSNRPASRGSIDYVMVTPGLKVTGPSLVYCKTVAATKKSNGDFTFKTLKDAFFISGR